jgi:molybdopterin molybdotransferase
MSGAGFTDVRNRGFGARVPFDVALAVIDSHAAALTSESVALAEAAGRVLAEPVRSAVSLPAFRRSAMDGFALRACETDGRALTLVGEALPAKPFARAIEAGEAVRITTGAPVPAGADAVLMVELAEATATHVRANEPIPAGKHVARIGEDVAQGAEVLPSGRALRPQDAGILAAIGVARVQVVRRPVVAVLATGNELLPPGAVPSGFRIADSNSPMLAALAARDGALTLPTQYVPDDFEHTRDALSRACDTADIVLLTGGTSVGGEDHSPLAVAALGELAVHGIAVRPASPTGVGFVRGKPVFLLPGNPVACLCAYDLFASRAVRARGGRASTLPYSSTRAVLCAEVPSAIGRVDYVRVRIRADGFAEPLPGGASKLSTVVEADGFVLVPANRAALAAGEPADVWLY